MESLKRFTDSIAHRGPDGSGYDILEGSTLGLGHRRLSILDLSEAGRQPMFSHDKKLVISFNGEIYNFIEIRKELQSTGARFSTETDTEVILAAYKAWGISCFEKFNGMFAIAIWDEEKKELLLARDRFGVKPLHFLYIPEKIFAFCSETIGFKHLDDFTRELDEKYFNIAIQQPDVLEGSGKTMFRNISQLLPGHYLTLKKDSAPKTAAWWDTSKHLSKNTKNYAEQIEEFRSIFEDACRLRLRSDVTVASALSGGLDSSSVFCTLNKVGKTNIERLPSNWQQAFVATFPGTTVDEKQFAEKVVKHINGKATYIVPDHKKLADEVVKATKLFDSCAGTPINSITGIYKAMKENGVTVSMDGHGVDEMMYGYNSYVHQAFYDALHKKEFDLARAYAEIICGLSPQYKTEDFKKIIKQFDRNIIEKGISFLKRRLATAKAAGSVRSEAAWLEASDQQLIHDISAQQKIPGWMEPSERTMYDDFHYKSLPVNLRDFDRASMQHGIEIRMPFMDYRLVSYVFSLPKESKLGGGFTKRILRDAMKNTLPEDIRTRTLKIGIGAPIEEWFSNELKQLVNDTIHSSSFINSSYWNGKAVKESLDKAYAEGRLNKNLCAKAWSLINAHLIIHDN